MVLGSKMPLNSPNGSIRTWILPLPLVLSCFLNLSYTDRVLSSSFADLKVLIKNKIYAANLLRKTFMLLLVFLFAVYS